jgi:hypothetical protein
LGKRRRKALMNPPSGVAQVLLGLGVIVGGGIVGGVLNKAALPGTAGGANAAMAQSQAVAAGAGVGALTAAFAGAVVGATKSKWGPTGRTTALVGLGLFTASALLGLGPLDRAITQGGGGTTPPPQVNPPPPPPPVTAPAAATSLAQTAVV